MDLFGRKETSEGTSNNDYMTLQECHDFGLRGLQSMAEIVATNLDWIEPHGNSNLYGHQEQPDPNI